jgi:hypothetical protein
MRLDELTVGDLFTWAEVAGELWVVVNGNRVVEGRLQATPQESVFARPWAALPDEVRTLPGDLEVGRLTRQQAQRWYLEQP